MMVEQETVVPEGKVLVDAAILARLEALEKRAEASQQASRPMVMYPDGTSEKSQEEIDTFLKEKFAKGVYFAEREGVALNVFPSTSRIDPVTGREATDQGFFLEFARWNGVGSELRDKKSPGGQKPLYRLGYVDLNRHVDIVNGTFDIDDMVKAIEKSESFQSLRIMPPKLVQDELRDLYADISAEKKRQAKSIKRKAMQLEGAHKAGQGV